MVALPPLSVQKLSSNSSFWRFCLVGAGGLLVDTATLYALMGAGISSGRARLASFLLAVIFTWVLNRRFTFAPARHGSLPGEAVRYLATMSLGGVLNLVVYAWVVRQWPDPSWTPALGVALGSAVGLSANYLCARWWVFATTEGDHPPRFSLHDAVQELLALGSLVLLFSIGAARLSELPGLYMDAVNPEYLAARILNPQLHNPIFAIPTASIPLLGNLYHGVQNLYVSLPFLAILGFSVPVLRFTQALFGVGIIALVYLVLRRSSGSRAIAWWTAATLAVELSFITSFRTQFHIVLAGTFWLLCAVCWALPAREDMPLFGRFRPFASGIAFGLAVYTYFVYLFFLPVWLLAARGHLLGRPLHRSWVAGCVLGMAPYALGYASLAAALGGIAPALDWIKNTVKGLAPMSSSLGLADAASNVVRNAHYAITNAGNELMIFGHAMPSSAWLSFKPFLLMGLWVISLGIAGHWVRQRTSPSSTSSSSGLIRPLHVVLLIVGYLCVSIPLGNRLWIHHFSVLIPLLYLCAGYALWVLFSRKSGWVTPVVGVVVVVLNLHQHAAFFANLERTGGVGKMSNSLALLAEEARRAPEGAIYAFPEWGFLMPFSLMTANQVPYRADLDPDSLRLLAKEGAELRVPVWQSADQVRYIDQLSSIGWSVHDVRSYLQRDRQEAFRVLYFRPCTPAPCRP